MNKYLVFLKKESLVWIVSIKWIYLKIISYLPSRTIRLFLLKKLGAKIGNKVSIFAGVEYRNPSKLSIGYGCSIGPNVLLDARCGITVGNNVTIAYGAILWTLQHDYNDKSFCTTGGKITIDDYAWICSRAIILPGISIGEGAVVSSGSVVTKNVQPYEIVGGVPAKKIGERENKTYSYTPYYRLHIV